jgi:hypothetical protein
MRQLAAQTMLRAAIVLGYLLIGCVIGAAADQAGFVPRVFVRRPGLGTVQEAWSLVLGNYVDRQALDTSRVSQGAITGLLM